MNRLLIFLAGMAVGLACAFVFIAVRLPKLLDDPAIACARSVAPAAIAASPSCVVPAIAVVVPPSPFTGGSAIAPPAPGITAPPAEMSGIANPQPSARGLAAVATTVALAPSIQPGPLLIPVVGIRASQLSDTFTDSRSGGRMHNAIDIMAPRGTAVVAADDGTVVKLFMSVQGGLTLYQFDDTRRVAFYYAHLDRYAPGVVEGKPLKRGDLVGYVGSSGDASTAAPHLHFAIFLLGPEKHWWKAERLIRTPFSRSTKSAPSAMRRAGISGWSPRSRLCPLPDQQRQQSCLPAPEAAFRTADRETPRAIWDPGSTKTRTALP